jgi:hypothetical protein
LLLVLLTQTGNNVVSSSTVFSNELGSGADAPPEIAPTLSARHVPLCLAALQTQAMSLFGKIGTLQGKLKRIGGSGHHNSS